MADIFKRIKDFSLRIVMWISNKMNHNVTRKSF